MIYRSINWATYPLPLLDREKLIAKAKEIEDKQTKIRERLDRFKDDFTTNSETSSVKSFCPFVPHFKNRIVGI